MAKSLKRSKSQLRETTPLDLAKIKRVLLLSQWIAAAGDRKAAAKAVGVGYTNAVESLRAYGVPLRSNPTSVCREDVLSELLAVSDAIKALVLRVKKADVDG